MSDKRRNDELEGDMSEEMELEIDEAVAAADEDGTPVPSGLGRFPLVPLREIVIFPEMVAPLKVGRDKSVAAIRAAAAGEGWLALITQREAEQEEITDITQLHDVGTLAKIAQVVNLSDGTIRAVVQGQKRIAIHSLDTSGPSLMVEVEIIEVEEAEGVEVEALMKSVQAQVETYVTSGAPVPPEAAVAAKNISDPGLLADMTAYTPDMTTEQRQELLEIVDVVDRLKYVSAFLARQIEILEIKGKIQSDVRTEMDKSQREYFLREQLKAIQRELGEDDPQQAETNELREKVEAADMPDEVRSRALKELDRLARIPSASPEVGVIRTYVDWLIAMPWNVATEDRIEISEAATVLSDDHYGLEKVKERIIEYLAVRKLAPQVKSPILCFAGPPGVGKTSLGKSIAKAMGRKFVRMSLGGLHDEVGAQMSVLMFDGPSINRFDGGVFPDRHSSFANHVSQANGEQKRVHRCTVGAVHRTMSLGDSDLIGHALGRQPFHVVTAQTERMLQRHHRVQTLRLQRRRRRLHRSATMPIAPYSFLA